MNHTEKDTRIIISVEGRKPIETTAGELNRLAHSLKNKTGGEIMKKRGMIRPKPGAEIRKTLDKALEHRAEDFGLKVENVTGFGMKDFQKKRGTAASFWRGRPGRQCARA
jgi:hypothetical protein